MKTRLPATTSARSGRDGNLAHKQQLLYRMAPYGIALGSGLLTTAAFPPLSIPGIAWIGLIPALAVALRPNAPAFRLGWLFGLGHFASSFAFVNVVFPASSIALGGLCALFPACWLRLVASLHHHLRTPPNAEFHPKNDPHLPYFESWGPSRDCLLILGAGVAWVAVEWLRSWMFSGFPWNPLGVSQWRNSLFLDITRALGIPAVSFLIAVGNTAFYLTGRQWLERRRAREEAHPPSSAKFFSAPLGMLVLLLAIASMMRTPLNLPKPDSHLSIACVQGNMPLIRAYTEDELQEAIRVHFQLSREAAKENPDLIVWPETAIPASLTLNADLALAFQELRREVKIPHIVGTIDYRFPPGATSIAASRSYNTAALYDDIDSTRPTATVDKAHIVPFGEFVPFEKWLPFLVDWIGMGRALTPGSGIPILTTPTTPSAQLGVLICYEDIFPDLTAKAAENGAQALLVITNDVWFGTTSGAEQHRINGLMRAIESGLPMIRAGNNSETMLIMPNGAIINPLRNPQTGSSFHRGFRVYHLPIWENIKPAPAIRRGPLLARSAALATLFIAFWCLWRNFDRKRRLLNLVMPDTE